MKKIIIDKHSWGGIIRITMKKGGLKLALILALVGASLLVSNSSAQAAFWSNWLKPKPATTQLSPSKSTSHSSGTSSDPYECRENTTTEITNVPRSGSISLETVNSSSQRTSTSSTSWVVAEGSYVNPSTGPGSVFITSLTAIPDSFINISVRARNPTAVCTLTLVTPGTGTITITGKVYKDSNNNNTYEVGDRVIPSATVKLEKPAGTSYSPVATTTSNSSGDYLLTYQGTSGSYAVSATVSDYSNYFSANFTANTGSTVTHNVQMTETTTPPPTTPSSITLKSARTTSDDLDSLPEFTVFNEGSTIYVYALPTNGTQLKQVSFYVDKNQDNIRNSDEEEIVDTQGPNFGMSIRLPAGAYVIRAKPTNTDNVYGLSVDKWVTVIPPNRPPVVSDFKAAKFKGDGTAPDASSFSTNPVEVTKGQKVMFTATVTDPDDANTNNGKLRAPELHKSDGTGYQNYTTGVTTVLNGSNANITLDTKDIPDGTNFFKLKATDRSGASNNYAFSSNAIEVRVDVQYEPFVIKLQSKPETGKSYGIKDSISIKAYQDNILVKEVICEYFCILEGLINGEVYTIEILPSLNWQGIKFEYRIGKGEIAPLSGMVELLDKFTARSVNVFLRPSSQNNTGFFSVTTKFAQSDPDRPKYICIQIYHIINNQKVIDKNKCGSTFHVELPSGTYYVGPDPDQHNSLDFIAPVEVQIRTAEKIDYEIILNPIHSKFTLKTTFWEKIDVTPYITDYYEIYIQGRLIEETSKNLVVTDAKDIKTNDDIKIKFQYKGAPFEWTGKITADPIDGNYQEIEIELSPLKCIEKIGNTNLSVPFCYDSDKGVNILSGNDEINNKAVLSISAEIAQLKSNYDETVLEKVYLTDEPADHATAKPKLNLIVITIPEFNGWKLDSQATPSALADTATHEYAHLYDWKMGGNKFYSKYNTDWQKITDSLLYDHKEKYVRDCVYSLPTVVCGELSKGGIRNFGGHPWDNNTEYFASTFSDVDNYEQTYLEKVNIIQYDYPKTLLLKGAELIKSYKK